MAGGAELSAMMANGVRGQLERRGKGEKREKLTVSAEGVEAGSGKLGRRQNADDDLW